LGSDIGGEDVNNTKDKRIPKTDNPNAKRGIEDKREVCDMRTMFNKGCGGCLYHDECKGKSKLIVVENDDTFTMYCYDDYMYKRNLIKAKAKNCLKSYWVVEYQYDNGEYFTALKCHEPTIAEVKETIMAYDTMGIWSEVDITIYIQGRHKLTSFTIIKES
jgi:hypothetical protein